MTPDASCANKWIFRNWKEKAEPSLDLIADDERRREILHSAARVLDDPADPNLYWFYQRIGPAKGAVVAKLAADFFMTYRALADPGASAPRCQIVILGFGEVPPK